MFLGDDRMSSPASQLGLQLFLNRDPHRQWSAGRDTKADDTSRAGADLDVPPYWRLHDGQDRERQSEVDDDAADERIDFSRIHGASASARRLALAAERSIVR